MKSLSAIFAVTVMTLTAPPARGQAFFGGGVVGFAPQISTVSSGVVLGVRATVSYDRKYVTLDMNIQDSDLLALHQFQVQTPFQAAGQAAGGQPVGGQPVGGQPVGGQPVGGQPLGGQSVGGQA